MTFATRRRVARSAALTAGLTALWLAVVYLSQVLLAAWFGAGRELDAYYAALALPTFLASILIESIALAFVPVFVAARSQDKTAAWRTANRVLILLVIVLVPLCALGVLLSARVIGILAPGFEPGRAKLATEMLQIIFPSLLFTSLAAILNAIYYALEKFLVPALSPLFSACVNLLIILGFSNQIGIAASAWGTLFGSLAQSILAVGILRGHFQFSIAWRDDSLAEIARLAAWRIVGQIFSQAIPLVERFIASTLVLGSITFLAYGSRVVTLLLGLFVQTINNILLPVLSERARETDRDAMPRALSIGMRMTALVALPLSALLIALAEPIVHVLFSRGLFDANASHSVALAVIAYSGVSISNSLVGAIVPALYALKQMRVVSLVSIAGVGVYLFGAIFLPRMFDYLGLALALSLNFIFNALLYAYVLFRHLRVQFDRQIARFYFQCALASLALFLAARWIFTVLGEWGNLVAIVGAGIFALVLYAGVLHVFHAPELALAWNALRARAPAR